MASPTSGAPSVAARNDSAATRASSAVMRSGVVSDHVAKSAPSSTIPRLVVVFPTSTASTACAAPFSSEPRLAMLPAFPLARRTCASRPTIARN